MILHNKKMQSDVATGLKKTCLIGQCYRHCCDTAIFLKNVNVIFFVSYNKENKLKLTFQFPLATGTFNKTQV